MAGFIEGVQRGQTVLFPDRLEDWIGEEDLVGLVEEKIFARCETVKKSIANATFEQFLNGR